MIRVQLLQMTLIIIGLLLAPVHAYPQAKQSDTKVQEISPTAMKNLQDCASRRAAAIKFSSIPHTDSRITAQERVRSETSSGWLDLRIGGGGSGDGAALILFAIIGIVIIIAVIPYATKYIYDLISGEDICYFHQFGFQYLNTRQNSDGIESTNELFSFSYTANIDRFHSADIGLAMEFGVQNLSLDQEGNYLDPIKRTFQKSGVYGMIGPKFYFARFLPSYSHGYLQILGGSSFDSELGALAKAEIGFNYFLSSKIGMGLGLGSLYFDMNAREGFFENDSRFSLYLSYSAIFSFD